MNSVGGVDIRKPSPRQVEPVYPPTEGNLSIGDIIDVIRTADPEYAESTMSVYSGAGSTVYAPASTDMGASASISSKIRTKENVYVRILEQPASRALRFRYECEGRSAGSIPGSSSNPENKTFPTIQVVGYKGRAVVVVSCVTKDPPYCPHPHNLVGKDCKKGVCTIEINNDNMICSFSNLGIQCVKKKDVEEALRHRQEIQVDPFQTGFSHRNQSQNIDLNSVRLCFQVFLEGPEKGKFTIPLKPLVSEAVYDKKAMCELVICKLSDYTSSVAGGKEIILLCEKVTKDDIQVRFYEEKDDQVCWEGYGDFQPTDVHKQVAISFRTPRYKNLEVESNVKLKIQLRRPSDGNTSVSRPFEFLPLDSETLKRKRQKLADSNSSRVSCYLQENVSQSSRAYDTSPVEGAAGVSSRPIRHPSKPRIKREAVDICSPVTSPSPGPSPVQMTQSPQGRERMSPAGPGMQYMSLAGPSSAPSYQMARPLTSFSFGGGSMIPVSSLSEIILPAPEYYRQNNQHNMIDYSQNLVYPPQDKLKPNSQQLPHQTPALAPAQLLNLDNQQTIEQVSSIELDMRNIDSGDLSNINLPMSDTNLSLVESHLSVNFNSSLNLIDSERNSRSEQLVKEKLNISKATEQQTTVNDMITKVEEIDAMQVSMATDFQQNMQNVAVVGERSDSITRLTASTIQQLNVLNMLSENK